jgi:ankyrin repeat protein
VLLDAGADPNLAVPGDGNPLIMAAQAGHLAIVRLLLDRGADVNAMVPEDENALINASSEGHLDVVQLLVDRGANVNAGAWAGRTNERPGDEWRTPLRMARAHGYRRVVEYLIAHGAID